MRNGFVLLLLLSLLVLTGCENKQLITCQNEKQVLESQTADLQQQLAQAWQTVEQRDQKIAEMKQKFDDAQTQALKSIQTMLEKQTAKTNEIKAQVQEKETAIKELTAQIDRLKQEIARKDQQIQELTASTQPPANPQ